MKGLVPCTNMGKFGGLNFICSMIFELGRLPNGYCDTRTELKAKVLPLNKAGSTSAPRTSMVWRIFMPASDMVGLNTFVRLPSSRSLPLVGLRTSTKSDVLVHVCPFGHCK